MNHPNDITNAQLWEPFDNHSLNSVDMIENIPVTRIIKALKRYYGRSKSVPFSRIIINQTKLIIAGRCWIENTVYSSVFDRKKKKESRRGNHFIMFNSSYIE